MEKTYRVRVSFPSTSLSEERTGSVLLTSRGINDKEVEIELRAKLSKLSLKAHYESHEVVV